MALATITPRPSRSSRLAAGYSEAIGASWPRSHFVIHCTVWLYLTRLMSCPGRRYQSDTSRVPCPTWNPRGHDTARAQYTCHLSEHLGNLFVWAVDRGVPAHDAVERRVGAQKVRERADPAIKFGVVVLSTPHHFARQVETLHHAVPRDEKGHHLAPHRTQRRARASARRPCRRRPSCGPHPKGSAPQPFQMARRIVYPSDTGAAPAFRNLIHHIARLLLEADGLRPS